MRIYEYLNVFKRIDYLLLIPVIILIFWGVINIYSASINEYPSLYLKQLIIGSVGIFLMLIISSIDYKKIVNTAPYIYIAVVILLFLVLIAGDVILGAKRWIKVGGFAVQPSEFSKIAVILLSAFYLSDKRYPISIFDAVIVFIIALIPSILTLIQPDLGTAITILIPVIFIVFLFGINKKYILLVFVISFLLSPLIWKNLKDYQKERIIAFLNPENDPLGSAYHIIQSKIAIGSGELTGKGFLEGTQSKLYFLPEQHTDFIFATIGEEWGFLASILIVTVYLFISLRILIWGNRVKESSGKVICFGVASLLLFQAFVNISMTLGMAPVVGITLPFLSYGGSSLLTFSILIGIVLSVISTFKKEKVHF